MRLSNSSLSNTLPQSRMNERQQKHPQGPQSSSVLHVRKGGPLITDLMSSGNQQPQKRIE